jgi:hypothetical protein
MPQLFEHREIEYEIAYGDTDARLSLRRLENPKRKILDREMRLRGDVDK